MSERSFDWTPAATASLAVTDVAFHEVVEAFLSALRWEYLLNPGTLLIIEGMADTGRVIRLAFNYPPEAPGHYDLLHVSTVTGRALDEWRSEVL